MKNSMRLATPAPPQGTRNPAEALSSARFPLSQSTPEPPTGVRVGKYVLYPPFASGGMASVHVGRQSGPLGFSRTVAIKRLHPEFASDPTIVSMLMDEARLSARVQHPNVVSVLDVVHAQGELFLVMDFIRGEALGKITRCLREQGEPVSVPIAISVIAGALHGLHAAHEVRDENGKILDLVHRDVSPQNILVGADGVARIVDFGVAKAGSRLQTTRTGEVKGKLDYMAPEQIELKEATRKVDIYAASVVLWEILAGRRLLDSQDMGGRLVQTLRGGFAPPSRFNARIHKRLDDAVMRGLARDPADRFATAREMAIELESCCTPATTSAVGAWVSQKARDALHERDRLVAEIESQSGRGLLPELSPTASPSGPATALHSAVRLQRPKGTSFEIEPESCSGEIVSCSVEEIVPASLELPREMFHAQPVATAARTLTLAKQSVFIAAGAVALGVVVFALVLGRAAPRRVENPTAATRAQAMTAPAQLPGADAPPSALAPAPVEATTAASSDAPTGAATPSTSQPSRNPHPARAGHHPTNESSSRAASTDFGSLTRH